MPSVNKKNHNDTEKKETIKDIDKKKNETIETTEIKYTMQIVLKPTFASAFQALNLINSRGINGYDIFPTMNNKGMKYQIVYHKKVTKSEAEELFEKIKDFGEFTLKLVWLYTYIKYRGWLDA